MSDDRIAGLFRHGEFVLHSGDVSNFKIDCDALTEADWAAVAAYVAPTLPPFGDAIGVPTGGHAFARALRPYVTDGPALIVDDVLTTGASMEQYRYSDQRGLVLFARNKPPSWVRAVFMSEAAADALLADADAEIARLREALEILLTRIEYGHLDDWKENDVDWFAVERARAALKDA